MSLLVPWQPVNTILDEIDLFRRQMGRVLGAGLGDVSLRRGLTGGYPAVNLCESDDFLFLESELPGIRLEDLEISIVGRNQLMLKGAHSPTQPEKVDWCNLERPTGTFERTIDLPVNVDPQQVEARLEDGILTLQMAKSPDAKPIKVTVKAEK